MRRNPALNVFKPTPSRFESKSEATTKAAREMIDKETDARNAKIARLKAARLAQDSATAAPAPASKSAPRKHAH